MSEYVTIFIDGKKIQAPAGANLLEVALNNGIDIPNLCYSSKLTSTGSCRLCIVKIKGIRGVTTSCTHTVWDGMEVTAFDEELEELRKTLIDMLLSSHNDDCISCSRDGNCNLQDLAFKYNLPKEERMLETMWQTKVISQDDSPHILTYDSSRCIMCERCVKACRETQAKGHINIINRGLDSYIGTGYTQWADSNCDGCGECAQACPVGAITVKSVYSDRKNIRVKDVDKTQQTTCPYCGVGCQLNITTMKNKIVRVEGVDEIPSHGSTCVKGRFGLDFVNHPDRLKKPLIRKNNELEEVSWDEAIEYTADRLNAILDIHGSDSIGGLSSARCTNEENYLFQKFMRGIVGTNNIDHCARLWHSSTVAGLAATLGSGAMTNSLAELENANVILVTGSNTTETHPITANFIKRAVLHNEAKLIVVDPRKIELVRYASVWLRPKNGTDVAWLNGLMNIITRKELHDKKFISERTEGFDHFFKTISNYTPDVVNKITGIPTEDLVKAATIYGNADRASIVYAMGITQHINGTDNVKSIANLAMITGNLGKESTGVNPLRGQNNVQGACDMGALPNVYPGYQKVADKNTIAKFEKAWNKELSHKNGLTIVEMMNAVDKGDLKALYIMGENPIISDPNSNHVRKALEKVEFLICQDIFLTETAEYADVIFPSASFAEKDGTFTNSERRVQKVNKVIKPIGTSKPDWEIIQLIANKLQPNIWNYSGWEDIMKEINLLTPQYAGITPKRIANGEKLQWPCPSEDHPGTKFLHKDKFARGLGLLTAIDHTPPAEHSTKEYPYILSTGRSLFHYHTGSMSRRSKSLNNFVSKAYCEMTEIDMNELGLTNGEMIKVSSRRGEISIEVKKSDLPAPGNIFIPFHFSEAIVNKLTLDKLDPVAKIPEYKVCAVKIEKIQ